MLRTCTLIWFIAATCFLAAPQLMADEARVRKDVVYSLEGKDGSTSLDIYAPATGANLPVMIWIHGGGWQYGDKAQVGEKPRALNERGFVLISINYRLQPATDFRGQAGDVAAAIRWVREHAAEFGGAADKLFLMGHSAGAHLAALVATDQRYLDAVGLKLSDLAGVVLLDGAAYDIPRQLELARIARLRELYLSAFTDDEATQTDASPIAHVAAGRGIPPFLILHIAMRRDGRIQSEALGTKLTEAGVSAKVISCAGKTHRTINREFGQPNDEPTRHVFEFLAPLARQ